MMIAKRFFLALMLTMFASAASAALQGDLAFSGFHDDFDVNGGLPGSAPGTINFGFLDFARGTDDFAYLNPFTAGDLFVGTIAFDAAGVVTTPIAPLMTVTNGGISTVFDLLSADVTVDSVSGAWSVVGEGTLVKQGVAGSTAATFFYTSQGVGSDSYSAEIKAVPIPAAAWLFGSGLIGLAGIARRKKAA